MTFLKFYRPLLLGGVLLVTLIAFADPGQIDLSLRLHAPDTQHWLGTDQLGRDVLGRILQGAILTFGIALVSVCLSAWVGVSIGLLAGYAGGWLDGVLMRLVDVQLALPGLLLALLVAAVLGPGLGNLIVVLVLTGWTGFARVIRAQVLQMRGLEFILGSHAIGAGTARILFRHILPNVASAGLVVATLEVARVIIVEASLSFLGLGIQPPLASWGRMLVEGQIYMAECWWVVTFPGLAIVCAVLAVNLLSRMLKRRFEHHEVRRAV